MESMTRLTIRLPSELHDRLEKAAARARRSLNAEVLIRLERDLDREAEEQ